MEKLHYPVIHETVYKEVLANGLTVMVVPKPGFHKAYGLFTTNYGSIDETFVPLGQEDFVTVPDGIAHFLEHKMFEKEDGDVFQIFSKQGASANAFTSFTRTSYLFSATNHLKENMNTLLDFVQQPYFTEETVNKEKGIIGQEIQMYQDDSNWRLFFGLLENMYPDHPLSIDIAGTVASIAEITAQDLYTCYGTFYHPANMNLLLVGAFEPEETLAWVRENQAQKDFAQSKPIARQFPHVDPSKILPARQITMPVSRPKVILGIKGVAALPADGKKLAEFRSAASFLFQLLVGNTTENYLTLYNQGIIDDSFGFEFSLERSFYFADFSCDTGEPEVFFKKLRQILLDAPMYLAGQEEQLEILKRKAIGKFMQSLNSLEYIANQFSQQNFGDVTLFDMPEIIEHITLADVAKVAAEFIKEEYFSEFTILPES